MRVITAIGHAGIKTPSGEYKLIPTLAAIATLDNPVQMYSDLTALDTPHEERVEIAHAVIMACSNDSSIARWLGQREVSKPRMRKGVITRTYSSVYIDAAHSVAIAEQLLFHGMVGKIERRAASISESDYTNTFDPLEWVSAVVAHLGLSEADAWNMTMTSILSALKTKFPPTEKQKALEKFQDEKADFDEWYKSIYGSTEN